MVVPSYVLVALMSDIGTVGSMLSLMMPFALRFVMMFKFMKVLPRKSLIYISAFLSACGITTVVGGLSLCEVMVKR